MTKVQKPVEYQVLSSELDAILLNLQNDSSDIDAALQDYDRGLKIIEQLQHYLKAAKHTVTELQARQAGPVED
jgi:exodeoxyribonuclease VII small subunit